MLAAAVYLPVLHSHRTTSGGAAAAIQPVGGMVSTFSSVVRRETFVGLWKGISPVSGNNVLSFRIDGVFLCSLYTGVYPVLVSTSLPSTS